MSVRRDIAFLIAGAAIGVPGGMFSNYLYDWIFPQVVSVETRQMGVQEIIPVTGHIEFKGSQKPHSKSSFVEVRYAEGTDTTRYRCAVTVSEPELFESVSFSEDCRRVNYTVRDPRLAGARHLIDDTKQVFFEIKITPPSGSQWVGTESIYVSSYPTL